MQTTPLTPSLYADFATQAQIDQQYNASLGLPDATAPGRYNAALAERARGLLPQHLDIPFGPTRAETLDVFPATPTGPGGAPVFVFIHGGYWRALSSKDFSGVALGLHARGITTVVLNYALCPFVTIDEIVRQVRAAVAWTVRHIAEFGGDPARIGVGGHSAGGHLTAMCMQTEWARDYGLAQDPIKARAPVAGKVSRVLVAAGETVALGQQLLCVEAMKMEMWLCAQAPGTVSAVHAQPGDQVESGALLAEIAPDPASPIAP